MREPQGYEEKNKHQDHRFRTVSWINYGEDGWGEGGGGVVG